MMNRDLTPDEVDSLIHDSQEPAQTVLPMPGVTEDAPQREQNTEQESAASDPLERTVERIFDNAWKNWSDTITRPLRAQPACGPTQMTPIDWPSVRRDMRPPVCMQSFRSAASPVLLIMENGLLYSMIDRLLGGGKTPGSSYSAAAD